MSPRLQVRSLGTLASVDHRIDTSLSVIRFHNTTTTKRIVLLPLFTQTCTATLTTANSYYLPSVAHGLKKLLRVDVVTSLRGSLNQCREELLEAPPPPPFPLPLP